MPIYTPQYPRSPMFNSSIYRNLSLLYNVSQTVLKSNPCFYVDPFFNVTNATGFYNNSWNSSFLCDQPSDEDQTAVEVSLFDYFVAIFLCIFILCILIGNTFVILSVLLFREMRTQTNGMIVSLASADLLVSIIVLPISLHFEIMDNVWTLGPIVCTFWITSDVFCCTASILNIVGIALDRYWLITKHVRYTHSKTFNRQRVCIMLALSAWVTSGIISVMPLIGWGEEKPDINDPTLCQITQDIIYTIISTFGAFWFPLAIILIVYAKIFRLARRRARSRAKQRAIHPSINTSTVFTEVQNGHGKQVRYRAPSESGSIPESPLTEGKNVIRKETCADEVQDIKEEDETPEVEKTDIEVKVEATRPKLIRSVSEITTPPVGSSVRSVRFHEDISENGKRPRLRSRGDSILSTSTKGSSSSRRASRSDSSRSKISNGSGSVRSQISRGLAKTYLRNGGRNRRFGLSRDPRARARSQTRSSARTLGLIIGGFVMCWLPFFILATVLPFCSVCNVPPSVMSISLWLGYSNSLLNPAIYAIWDKNFRRSFKRLAKCEVRWHMIL